MTAVASVSPAQQPTVTSSYGPTNQTETFGQIKAARMAVKAGRAKAHADLLVTVYEMFNGILNPKQLEGLRLLVTQFPQQQFNATEDRRTDRPEGMLGVTCFDCHANGHTNGAAHLVGDIRPQEFRHRIETPSLHGVNIQRLFGSQRALKTVEDFTEFEQRAAYFDGDHVMAAKKGANMLERGSTGAGDVGVHGDSRLPSRSQAQCLWRARRGHSHRQ